MTSTTSTPAEVDTNRSLKTVRASGSWEGTMVTRIQTRDFSFRTDEPEPVGGTNHFPTPMEYVAGALNGCVTVVIESVANEFGVVLERVETNSEATMDVRGFRGTADVSPHFHNYTLHLDVVTKEPVDDLPEFKRQVERRCPAINLVRDAGVRFELKWNITAAQVQS